MLIGSGATPTASGETDKARRRVVALVTLVYVLLMTEGVLRKWLMPGLSQLLFFVRDPFVLAAYAVASVGELWPRGEALLQAGMVLGVLALVLAVVQLAAGVAVTNSPLLFALYGWRNYFLYVPLAFLIAATFTPADLARITRITLLLAVPVAILVVLQFYSPGGAVINVGSADDPTLQFRGLGLDEFHTRPMGLFTSDTGQSQFTVSCLAMALATWFTPAAAGRAGRVLLAVATISVLVCLAFSGSRGAVLHAAIVVAFAVLLALRFAKGGQSMRIVGVLLGVAAVAFVLYPVVFHDGFQALADRWHNADASESQQFSGGIFGRALYSFVDFGRLVGGTPLLGYGLGVAGNASTLLGTTIGGLSPTAVAETDWSRHIVDLGPIVGVLYIVYRFGLVAKLLHAVLGASSRADGALAVMLFGFVMLELLSGQIAGQGTINGYCWLFTGFCLAAATRDAGGSGAANQATAPAAGPLFPNLLR